MDARTNPGAMNQDDADLYNQGGLVGDNQIIYQAQAEMIDVDDVSGDQANAQADTNDTTNEDDPDAIRQNIEQTRSHMSDTIDAIQERLSPQRLVSDAKESVKEATIGRVQDMANNVRDSANDAGFTVMDTVRQNPIPALMTGLGLGWLVYKGVNSSSGRRRGRSAWNRNYYRTQPYDYGYGYNVDPYAGQPYGSPDNWESYNRPGTMPNGTNDADNSPGLTDRAGQAADQIKGKASDIAGNVQDSMGQFTDTVQERAGDFGDTMQQGAYQARDWLQETWQDNPLLLSAGVVLLGIGVGLLLKESPQEQQLMGEAHDNLMQKAQGVAQDTAQKVQQVAKTAASAAQDEAKNQGLGGQQNQSSQKQSQASSR